MDWLMRETESGHALAATVSGCTGMNVDLLFFEAPKQNKGASRGAPPESIFDSLLGTSSAPAMGAQSRLPRNAERFTFKGYEEIHVPPMKAAGASIANWDLVRIDAMPALIAIQLVVEARTEGIAATHATRADNAAGADEAAYFVDEGSDSG